MAILVRRFQCWLDKAEIGDIYQYHYGILSVDRLERDGNPNEIDVLANEVIAASDAGKVFLFQQRSKGKDGVENGNWLYFARREPVPVAVKPRENTYSFFRRRSA